LSTRHRWEKILALGLFATICLGLILTMSRGAILAAVVTVMVFFWRLNSSKLKSLKPRIRRLLLVVIIVAVAAAATVPTSLLERFQQSAADRGAGRLDIWAVGLATLKDYGVVGAGLNNFPVVYNKYAGYASHQSFKTDRDPHNVYLGVAVEGGVVGLFLLLMALRVQFKIASKVRARTVSNSMVLISCEATCWGVLFGYLFGNFLWEKMFWIAWVMFAFALTVQAAKNSAA
jgi:O-antigen ligase